MLLLVNCGDVLRDVTNPESVAKFLSLLRSVAPYVDDMFWRTNPENEQGNCVPLSVEQANAVLDTFKLYTYKVAELLKNLTESGRFDQQEIDQLISGIMRSCLIGKLELDHIAFPVKIDSLDGVVGAIMSGQITTISQISINLGRIVEQPVLGKE